MKEFIKRCNPYTEQAKENTAFLYNLLAAGLKITSATYAATVAEAVVIGVKTPYFNFLYGGIFFLFNAINFAHYTLLQKRDSNLDDDSVRLKRERALSVMTHAKTAANIVSETVEYTVMMSLATLTALDLESKENPEAVAGTFSGFFALNLAHTILLHYFKDHPEKEPGIHKVLNRYAMNTVIVGALAQQLGNTWLYDGPGNIEDAQSVAIGSIAAGFALNVISALTETIMKNCLAYKAKYFDSFHLGMLRASEILSVNVFLVVFAMNTMCNQIDCNNPSYSNQLTAMFLIFNVITATLGLFTSIHTEENKPHRAAPTYEELLKKLLIDSNENENENENDRPRNYGAIQHV